eukprot:1157849-Pelagomonas_calceolata.AAC.11
MAGRTEVLHRLQACGQRTHAPSLVALTLTPLTHFGGCRAWQQQEAHAGRDGGLCQRGGWRGYIKSVHAECVGFKREE